MNCDEMDLLLAAYVDGVAEADDRRFVEAHLSECAACREDVARQRAVRRLLTAQGRTVSDVAPPGLEIRIAARLAAERPPAVVGGWGVRVSAFAAAALVVLAAGAVLLPAVTSRSTVVLAAQLALDHLKCFVLEPHDHGETVTVADAEAELKTDYGWDLAVPATGGTPDGRLVAVRRCLYGDGRAAHILYLVGGDAVSLFILPGLERPTEELTLLGQDSVVWNRDGRTYMLVGSAGLGSRLHSMASNLRNGAE
jgi:anti-sigma factor RsiW